MLKKEKMNPTSHHQNMGRAEHEADIKEKHQLHELNFPHYIETLASAVVRD